MTLNYSSFYPNPKENLQLWRLLYIYFFFGGGILCCPNGNFSHGKFGSHSPRKASCNRVALPNPNVSVLCGLQAAAVRTVTSSDSCWWEGPEPERAPPETPSSANRSFRFTVPSSRPTLPADTRCRSTAVLFRSGSLDNVSLVEFYAACIYRMPGGVIVGDSIGSLRSCSLGYIVLL